MFKMNLSIIIDRYLIIVYLNILVLEVKKSKRNIWYEKIQIIN